MRKINKAGLRRVQLPLPSLDAQVEYAQECAVIAKVSLELGREVAVLRTFRSGLLQALLLRHLEVPEAYDVLLDVGVA